MSEEFPQMSREDVAIALPPLMLGITERMAEHGMMPLLIIMGSVDYQNGISILPVSPGASMESVVNLLRHSADAIEKGNNPVMKFEINLGGTGASNGH